MSPFIPAKSCIHAFMTLLLLWTGTFLHDSISPGHEHGHLHSHVLAGSHDHHHLAMHGHYVHQKIEKTSLVAMPQFGDDIHHAHGAVVVSRASDSTEFAPVLNCAKYSTAPFVLACDQIVVSRYQRPPPPLFASRNYKQPLYLINQSFLL